MSHLHRMMAHMQPEPAAHFTPWQTTRRPCWHCSQFVGLLYGGSAAACRLSNGPRVRSMPASGCASFEREPGTDDEPDAEPSTLASELARAGPWKAHEHPVITTSVRWAP